jgi:hypothetical protein
MRLFKRSTTRQANDISRADTVGARSGGIESE